MHPDQIDLTHEEMRTIMQTLYDSTSDEAAELHDKLADYYSRMTGSRHAAGTLNVTNPINS